MNAGISGVYAIVAVISWFCRRTNLHQIANLSAIRPIRREFGEFSRRLDLYMRVLLEYHRYLSIQYARYWANREYAL